MVNQSAMVRLTVRNLSAGWKIVLVTRVSTRDQWHFESDRGTLGGGGAEVHATNGNKKPHTTHVPRFASSVMSQSFQTKKGVFGMAGAGSRSHT